MSDDESTRGRPGRRGKTRRGMSTWVQESAFACCCVGFLNPRGEGSKAYYALLGLPKSATLADIKKAYKKLSLAHHPDKLAQRGQTLTEEMQEEFRKIKQAYEVLSDPPRRRTYDRFGENGLLLMEDGPGAILGSPAKMQEVLRAADSRAHCVVLSVFLLVLSYIIAVPLLFGLRVDGDLGSAPFALIFLPLWLVEALMLAAMVTSVAQGPSERPPDLKEDEQWEDEDPLYLRQMSLATFALYLFAQAMVVAKLDDGLGTAPWLAVLVPYYLYEGALLASMWHAQKEALAAAAALQEEAAKKASQAFKSGGDDDDEEAGRPDEMGFDKLMGADAKRLEASSIVPSMYYHGARLLQVFLIALQVDGWFLPQDMEGAWWVVLLPTLLYACSQFFGCYISTKQAKAVAKEAAEQAQAPLPDPPTLQNMAEREFQKHQASQKAEFHASMAQGALCGGGCLALYGLLLGFYLAPPEGAFSFFWFYFPCAVLVGCPLCVLLTGAACELGGCIVDPEEEHEKKAALVRALEKALNNATSKPDCDLDAPLELSPELQAGLQEQGVGFDASQPISVRFANTLLEALKAEMAESSSSPSPAGAPADGAAAAGDFERADVEAPPVSSVNRPSLSAEVLASMSVKELKAMAASEGVSTAGCTEKSEIVALLLQGQSASSPGLDRPSLDRPSGSNATRVSSSQQQQGTNSSSASSEPRIMCGVVLAEDASVVEPAVTVQPPEPEEDIGDID